MTYNTDDILGNGFKFVSYEASKNRRKQAKVICPQCEKPFISDLADIERKKKTCLGCSNKNKAKHSFKHGYSRHPLGLKFKAMLKRCYAKTDVGYENYGGRGIKICDEWLNDRVKFFKWAEANGYEEGLEIDRIDNDKGYSPNNCRFVTRDVNQRGMRKPNDRTQTKYGYFGIKPDRMRWVAKFTSNGKQHYAGSAATQKEAAILHDAYVIIHKLDRKLNFP